MGMSSIISPPLVITTVVVPGIITPPSCAFFATDAFSLCVKIDLFCWVGAGALVDPVGKDRGGGSGGELDGSGDGAMAVVDCMRPVLCWVEMAELVAGRVLLH